MVLGKLPVPGRPTIWIRVGQGPTALAVGAGGDWFGHFFPRLSFLFFLPPLWDTARYRLKYCLKGPLSPKNNNNINEACEILLSECMWQSVRHDSNDIVQALLFISLVFSAKQEYTFYTAWLKYIQIGVYEGLAAEKFYVLVNLQ